MANALQKHSELTFRQQGLIRSKLMASAAMISEQIREYVETGKIVVAGQEYGMTPERLATYRLVYDRTVPTLSATEITHRSGIETMDTTQIVSRLSQLVKVAPELREQLYEALGASLINAKAELIGPSENFMAKSEKSGELSGDAVVLTRKRTPPEDVP